MVGAINLHKGLSPSSQRPCWAHNNQADGKRLPYVPLSQAWTIVLALRFIMSTP